MSGETEEWSSRHGATMRLVSRIKGDLSQLRLGKEEILGCLVAAGLARCCRLWDAMDLMHTAGMDDLLGLALRPLAETWLASMYLLLGEGEAYDVLVVDYKLWRERLHKDIGLDVEDFLTGGKFLSTNDLCKRVRTLLEAESDPDSDFPTWIYKHLYAAESLLNVHGRFGTLERYFKENEELEIVIAPGDPDQGHGRLLAGGALIAVLATRLYGKLGLDDSEVQSAANELRKVLVEESAVEAAPEVKGEGTG